MESLSHHKKAVAAVDRPAYRDARWEKAVKVRCFDPLPIVARVLGGASNWSCWQRCQPLTSKMSEVHLCVH